MALDLTKLRILVVDDQLLVRSLLTQSLKAMGVNPENIYQAIDGATAKRALDGKPVDLVLCDLQMEPMNGMDLLKEIRCGRTMNPPNMPFVFLSGHAEKQNIVLAAQLHADGFVIKPPQARRTGKKHRGRDEPRPPGDGPVRLLPDCYRHHPRPRGVRRENGRGRPQAG